MNLGRAVKLCRTSRGMRQSDLAKRARVSAATISLIETGDRDASLGTMSDIAAALGVPLEILVFLASDQGEVSGLPENLRRMLSDAAMGVLSDRPAPTLL